MANSPTTVLPAPVGAQTRTPEPASSASHASTWKGSSEKPSSAVKSARAGWAVRLRAAAYRSAGLDMPSTLGVAVRGRPSARDPGRESRRTTARAALQGGSRGGLAAPVAPRASVGDERVVEGGDLVPAVALDQHDGGGGGVLALERAGGRVDDHPGVHQNHPVVEGARLQDREA